MKHVLIFMACITCATTSWSMSDGSHNDDANLYANLLQYHPLYYEDYKQQLGQLNHEPQQSLPSITGSKRQRGDDDDDQADHPSPPGAMIQSKDTQADKQVHKCSYCDFTAKFRSLLVTHERIHTGERPYKCTHPGCGYDAAQRDDLARHMRRHTGERPYKCAHPGCPYTAIQSSHLAVHLRTHLNNECSHKCTQPGCNYVTTQRGNLRVHISTHWEKLPYKCAHLGCDYTTAQTDDFARHMHTCSSITNNNQQPQSNGTK